MKNLKTSFELSIAPEGGTYCQFSDGRTLTIASSGIGFDFAQQFLHLFSRHHQRAIDSARALVRRLLNGRQVTERQETCMVASTCANCAFGARDTVQDFDSEGRFNYEYHLCPMRDCCPYNGYKTKAGADSICNPAFALPLNDNDAQIADILAHTGTSLAGIAAQTGYSEGTIRNKASRIYEQLGLVGREALMDLGRGRRFII